jgi:hypothetical protein
MEILYFRHAHRTICPQKQAILAYANLKMQSNDFSSYLQENKLLQTCMGKLGNPGSTHSDGEIKTNWQNAIKEVSTRNQTTPSSV